MAGETPETVKDAGNVIKEAIKDDKMIDKTEVTNVDKATKILETEKDKTESKNQVKEITEKYNPKMIDGVISYFKATEKDSIDSKVNGLNS